MPGQSHTGCMSGHGQRRTSEKGGYCTSQSVPRATVLTKRLENRSTKETESAPEKKSGEVLDTNHNERIVVIKSNGYVAVKETQGRVGFKDEHKDEHSTLLRLTYKFILLSKSGHTCLQLKNTETKTKEHDASCLGKCRHKCPQSEFAVFRIIPMNRTTPDRSGPASKFGLRPKHLFSLAYSSKEFRNY